MLPMSKSHTHKDVDSVSEDELNDDENWLDVGGPVETYEPFTCPIGSQSKEKKFRSLTDWLNHLTQCGICADLRRCLEIHNITDTTQWIKFLNFVRRNKLTSFSTLLEKSEVVGAQLADDENLCPPEGPDPLLTIDLDEVRKYFSLPISEVHSPSTDSKVSEKLETILSLKEEVARLTEERRYFTEVEGYRLDPDKLPATRNDTYFTSYGIPDIHDLMLRDRIRTGSYHDFILKNADEFFHNKVVLDIGCGTGILSFFSCQAGARKVHSVDCANIIVEAMELAYTNGLTDRIEFHSGSLETLKHLPFEEVDVIISEWMGSMLLYEQMLDSVLYARNCCPRRPLIFPRCYSIRMCPVEAIKQYFEQFQSYDNFYAINMESFKRRLLRRADIRKLKGREWRYLSEPQTVFYLDLQQFTTWPDPTQLFSSDFSFQLPTRDSSTTASPILTNFTAWFEVEFEPSAKHLVNFSTSPSCPTTHWMYTNFWLDEIKELKGDQIEGYITVHRHPVSERGISVYLKATCGDEILVEREYDME